MRPSSARSRRHGIDELDADAARDAGHHVPSRSGTEILGGELDLDVLALGESVMQLVEPARAGPERQVVEPQVVASIEGFVRRRLARSGCEKTGW